MSTTYSPEHIACAIAAAMSPRFIEEWARLRGIKLPTAPRTPIEMLVDQAAGYGTEWCGLFMEDMKDVALGRIDPDLWRERV